MSPVSGACVADGGWALFTVDEEKEMKEEEPNHQPHPFHPGRHSSSRSVSRWMRLCLTAGDRLGGHGQNGMGKTVMW